MKEQIKCLIHIFGIYIQGSFKEFIGGACGNMKSEILRVGSNFSGLRSERICLTQNDTCVQWATDIERWKCFFPKSMAWQRQNMTA